jgi:AraC family transcriptional regulator, dual regulator of chb operon
VLIIFMSYFDIYLAAKAKPHYNQSKGKALGGNGMEVTKLIKENIIDKETEAHYSFQSTLKGTTGLHCHDFFEFFLITEGRVGHIVNGCTQLLEEGSLVFIRPRDCHYYQDLEKSYCNFINLAFSQEVIFDLFRYLGNCIDSNLFLTQELPAVIQLSKSSTKALKKKLQSLNLIPQWDKQIKRAELRTILVEIFTRYFLSSNLTKSPIPSDWLELLCNEMRKKEHFTEGMPALLRLSGRTHEHVCREMKKQLGTTPTDFINLFRLEFATNLILNTDSKISDIAIDAGFEALSHFFHLFRRMHGMSPSEFRRG